MTYVGEDKIYIWLDSFPLQDGEKHALLEEAGSPRLLVKNLREIFPKTIKRGKESVYNSMLSSLCDDGKYYQSVLSSMEKRSIQAIPVSSPLYPKPLKELTRPPLVLYAIGDVSLLSTPCFAIVGSRITPDKTMLLSKAIARDLSSHYTLITGVADGGDRSCVEGALLGTGRVICVAAGGLDSLPKSANPFEEVAKKGLLLSYKPLRSPVRSFSYETRNEILATLSFGGLIVSGEESSGALITAKYLKQQNKPIFSIPYPPQFSAGSGCNALLKGGGILTEGSEDVLTHFGVQTNKVQREEIPLSPDESQIVQLLKGNMELPIAIIGQKTGFPIYKLNSLITSLEVKGVILKTGGNQISLRN
jgi:DNA processing protein